MKDSLGQAEKSKYQAGCAGEDTKPILGMDSIVFFLDAGEIGFALHWASRIYMIIFVPGVGLHVTDCLLVSPYYLFLTAGALASVALRFCNLHFCGGKLCFSFT